MMAERIYLLLAFNGFFLAPLSKLQSAQETKKGFHLPDIVDMYSSHQGQAITAIGLSQNELTDVLSTVLRYDFVKQSDVRSPTALKKELLTRHVDMGEGANNGLVVYKERVNFAVAQETASHGSSVNRARSGSFCH